MLLIPTKPPAWEHSDKERSRGQASICGFPENKLSASGSMLLARLDGKAALCRARDVAYGFSSFLAFFSDCSMLLVACSTCKPVND